MKYKKFILDKLPDCTITEILDSLVYLKSKARTNFLKQYSLTSREEEREYLTKAESEYNSELLKRLYNRICEKRKGLFTYRVSKKYKTYIFDKLPNCSFEEIETEISYLKPKIRERLLKEYSLISRIDPIEYLTKSDSESNSYIIKKIYENILYKRNNPNIIIKTKDKKEKPNKMKYPSFFSLFKNQTKENILLAIECLEENEKNLLYKKYGEDLLNTKINKNLTTKEIETIRYGIIRKIKRILEKLETGNYIIVGIEDEFDKNITFNQIKNATDKTTNHFKKVIYHYFGENLKKKTIIPKEKLGSILPQNIKENLNKTIHNQRIIHSTFKPFVTQLKNLRKENETDEELLLRAKKEFYRLTKIELELLYRKYNEDLQNTTNERQFTKKENYDILQKIIPKIIWYMKNPNQEIKYCRPLKSHFDGLTSFKEVLDEINTLPIDEQQALKEKYQENYLGVTPINSINRQTNKHAKRIVDKLMKRFLARKSYKTGIDLPTLRKIKCLLETEEYINLKNFIYNDYHAASIIIYINLGDIISLEQISKLTNTQPLIILTLTKNYIQTKYQTYKTFEENIKINELTKKL